MVPLRANQRREKPKDNRIDSIRDCAESLSRQECSEILFCFFFVESERKFRSNFGRNRPTRRWSTAARGPVEKQKRNALNGEVRRVKAKIVALRFVKATLLFLLLLLQLFPLHFFPFILV